MMMPPWCPLVHISAYGEEGFFPAYTSRGPRARDSPGLPEIKLQGRRNHRVRVAGRGLQSRHIPTTHTSQLGAAGPLPSTPSMAAYQLSWMAESRLRSGVPKAGRPVPSPPAPRPAPPVAPAFLWLTQIFF